MAHLKFDAYQVNDLSTNAVLVRTIEFDNEVETPATVERLLKEVRELHADKATHVSCNNEVAAYVLLKRKSGGRRVDVPDEVVVDIHKFYVEDNEPISRIGFLLFDAHKDAEGNGLELRENIIKSVLMQERGTDVEGIDDLRTMATAKVGSGSKGRVKHTEADKDEWVRMHVEDELSGSAIGKALGINSATINAHLKKEGVQRNARGRTKKVVAEQVA